MLLLGLIVLEVWEWNDANNVTHTGTLKGCAVAFSIGIFHGQMGKIAVSSERTFMWRLKSLLSLTLVWWWDVLSDLPQFKADALTPGTLLQDLGEEREPFLGDLQRFFVLGQPPISLCSPVQSWYISPSGKCKFCMVFQYCDWQHWRPYTAKLGSLLPSMRYLPWAGYHELLPQARKKTGIPKTWTA